MSSQEPPAIKWIIYEPTKAVVTRIIPELAEEIGLNESIVLLQISFWINTSDNLKDGKYWTYQTMNDMKEKAFRYWSVDTIRRTVHSLKKMGYILIENHNKRKGDNTQWFALEPDKISSLKSILCLPSDQQTRKEWIASTPPSNLLVPPLQTASTPLQDRTTLPETPTETPNSFAVQPETVNGGLPDDATPPVPSAVQQAAKIVEEIGDKPIAPEKKPRAPHPNEPYRNALLKCWNMTPETVTSSGDKTYWIAAADLAKIKFPLDWIPDYHKWCKTQDWDSFTVMAMGKHAGEYKAERELKETKSPGQPANIHPALAGVKLVTA